MCDLKVPKTGNELIQLELVQILCFFGYFNLVQRQELRIRCELLDLLGSLVFEAYQKILRAIVVEKAHYLLVNITLTFGPSVSRFFGLVFG
jgi:hypothetical protein